MSCFSSEGLGWAMEHGAGRRRVMSVQQSPRQPETRRMGPVTSQSSMSPDSCPPSQVEHSYRTGVSTTWSVDWYQSIAC